MPGILTADSSLETQVIADFSPGIHRYARGGIPLNYSPSAPLGSCSQSFRCINRPSVGLIPLPQLTKSFSIRTPTNPLTGSANVWAPLDIYMNSAGNFSYIYQGLNSTSHQEFHVTSVGDVYVTTSAGTNTQFPAFTITNAASFYANPLSIFTHDPVTNVWVEWPISATSGGSTSTFTPGSVTGGQATVSQATSRALIMGNPTVYYSGLQVYTGWSSELFAPDNIMFGYGMVGSISTGETIFLPLASGAPQTDTGATVVYGDIGAPSSAIYFPGIQPCSAYGRPLPSPIGLIYPGPDGIYLWNGGNTSQRISTQIPDDQFVITPQGTNTVAAQSLFWMPTQLGTWSILPNNWVYDTEQNSWWKLEDDTLVQFAGGLAAFSFGGNATLYMITSGSLSNVAPADFAQYSASTVNAAGNFASSYTWDSNLIPIPGSNLELQAVEICASNPTSTPCTITVTPGPPPGTSSLPANQNTNQPLPFTIPANTAGYRGMLRCGYTDYNLSISVVAANSNTNNPAPILHEIVLGYSQQGSNIQ